MIIIERILLSLLGLGFLVGAHGISRVIFEAHGWKPMTPGDWGVWVGAVGTIGTLLGTLWIATQETRRRRTEAEDAAIIAAAAIDTKLSVARAQLEVVIKRLRVQVEDDGKPWPYKAFAALIRKCITWDVENLAALVHVKGRAAAKIVLAQESALLCARLLESNSDEELDLWETAQFNNSMADDLQVALAMLEGAQRNCQSLLDVQEFR